MKKCLRFGAFVGVLALSLAAGLSRPAAANPSPCSTVNGKTCSPNGSHTTCDEGGGVTAPCTCISGHWRCTL